MTAGPLAGTRVIELAALGPAPFATMLLADLGADVIRVDRPAVGDEAANQARADVVNRGKRSVAVDIKAPEGLAFVQRLVQTADVLVEGFRPGVTERLGLGPVDLMPDNPQLVYARMTGWGQEGPLAHVAGHDIDYIALTGALWALGREDEVPSAPLNLLGDYAGGSMFLVMGILAALLEARSSGVGQVIDAAMVDGTAVLTTMFTALSEMGAWDLSRRAANPLDTAAPWYDVYACADDRWIAVGALEPQFYAQLVSLTDFRAGHPDRFVQPSPEQWADLKQEWVSHWRTRPRDEWVALLAGTDACAQPVLDWSERAHHPHLVARGTFRVIDGVLQAAPAPRLSRTPLRVQRRPPAPGEHGNEIALELGLSADEIATLRGRGALAVPNPHEGATA